jgi:hypothetical protein
MSLPSDIPPFYISPLNPDLTDPIETSPLGDNLVRSDFMTEYGFKPNLPLFSDKPPKSAEKPQAIADAVLQFHLDKADSSEEELVEEIVDLLDEKITSALTIGLDLVDEIFDSVTSDKQIDSIAGCLSFCVYNALIEIEVDEVTAKKAQSAAKAEIQVILKHPGKSKEAIYDAILTVIPSFVIDL